MAIDVTRDELIPLAEAAKRFLPKVPSACCLWRWWRKGVKVETRRVKLETVQVGGRSRYTTEDAIRRFITETNPPTDAAPAAEKRDRQGRQDRELRAQGILRPKAAGVL